MSDIKKNVLQIGPNGYLFFSNPGIFYFLTFEIVEIFQIRIILIKMQLKETYVFETIIQFDELGTDDVTPEETLQNISFLINNYDFSVKEESNKVKLMINSKNKASIDLLLYQGKEGTKEQKQKEQLNNMQNTIQDLLNTIMNQEQKINELKQKEENHKNLLNKIDEVTSNIKTKLDNEENNNNRPNNYRNYNRANTTQINYQNQYFDYINNNSNNPNKPNIIIQNRVVFSPYLPDNVSMNNLLSRPEYRPPPQIKKVEPKRAINLDNIENYHP